MCLSTRCARSGQQHSAGSVSPPHQRPENECNADSKTLCRFRYPASIPSSRESGSKNQMLFFFFCKVGRTKRRANSTRNMLACSGSAAVAYRRGWENVGRRTGTCKSRGGGGGVRGLSLTVADASSSRSGVRAGGYSSYTQCTVHALRIPAVPLCHPSSQPLW